MAASALALVAILAGCGEDGGGTPTTVDRAGFAAVSGNWSGTLRQAGTKPFPIEARIESQDDPTLNVVRYGGEIDCSGNWTFEGEAGERVLFREVIDRGRDGACKGVGTVRLTPTGNPDELEYEFRGGGVESAGVLRREG